MDVARFERGSVASDWVTHCWRGPVHANRASISRILCDCASGQAGGPVAPEWTSPGSAASHGSRAVGGDLLAPIVFRSLWTFGVVRMRIPCTQSGGRYLDIFSPILALVLSACLACHRQMSWHYSHNRFNTFWQCTVRWCRLAPPKIPI